MSLNWGSMKSQLLNDNDSWTLAKKKMGVEDVRELSSSRFHDLIALAQSIKKGNSTQQFRNLIALIEEISNGTDDPNL